MRRKYVLKKMTADILAAGMLLGAAGCETAGLSNSTSDLTGQIKPNSADDVVSSTDESEGEIVSGMDEEFIQSYMQFSLNLLKESRVEAEDTGKSSMLSPLSVLMALEMTREGAEGETQAQLEKVLYPEISAEKGEAGLQWLCSNLPEEAGARFHMANSVWLKTAGDVFVPDEEFLLAQKEKYNAEIYGAPFDDTTCRDINYWVKQRTDGMVTDILDAIPADAMLYLINAIAFEAEWETVYEANDVHDAVFVTEEGEEQQISMMYEMSNRYLSMKHAEGFCKAYQNGYDFVALLPKEGLTLDAFLQELDGRTLLETIQNERDIMIETGLPKFTGETFLDLAEVLRALGMPLAFDGEKADFSGMGTCTSGNRLCISRVLHKTYIDVDELGTKAGAATVVEAVECSAAELPKQIILNRPFLYAIVEQETGIPVFIGTMENCR